jgi:hypothetical protein
LLREQLPLIAALDEHGRVIALDVAAAESPPEDAGRAAFVPLRADLTLLTTKALRRSDRC